MGISLKNDTVGLLLRAITPQLTMLDFSLVLHVGVNLPVINKIHP